MAHTLLHSKPRGFGIPCFLQKYLLKAQGTMLILVQNSRQPSQIVNFQKIKFEKNTRNMNANTLIDLAEGTKSGIH